MALLTDYYNERTKSLNPCSNGIPMALALSKVAAWPVIVLILVLMEYLWPILKTNIKWKKQCLNPCSNGIPMAIH